MPQEPKKRHSRQRQGKRRASIHLQTQKGTVCPNCKVIALSHTVCDNCGYYKGKQILFVKKNQEKELVNENTA